MIIFNDTKSMRTKVNVVNKMRWWRGRCQVFCSSLYSFFFSLLFLFCITFSFFKYGKYINKQMVKQIKTQPMVGRQDCMRCCIENDDDNDKVHFSSFWLKTTRLFFDFFSSFFFLPSRPLLYPCFLYWTWTMQSDNLSSSLCSTMPFKSLRKGSLWWNWSRREDENFCHSLFIIVSNFINLTFH